MRRQLLGAPLNKQIVKGWATFTGETTVSIRDSWNVSSISRTTTGDYTVNWSRAFGYGTATAYAMAMIAKLDGGAASVTSHASGGVTEGNAYTNGFTRLNTSNNGTNTDADLCSIVVLGA